jgi:hypothetical protein
MLNRPSGSSTRPRLAAPSRAIVSTSRRPRAFPGARAKRDVRFLEHGHIYFFYRPKLGTRGAAGLEDVQRFYVILAPRGKASYRLIVIGEKRLPAVKGRGGDRKSWGFVEKVAHAPEGVEDELDPKTYLTRTRGERRRPPARPAGEGVYVIVRHRNHTHLAYRRELPAKPGAVQETLNILDQASYIVAVKNPRAPAAPGIGLDEGRRARLPATLQRRFRRRRFINLEPPDLLDHEGVEILLVGTRVNVVRELGVRLEPQHETAAAAATFEELGVEQSVHPVAPLLEGTWA